MTDFPPEGRAKLAYIVGVREAADYAYDLARDAAIDYAPGELIRNTRRLKLFGFNALDRAVIAEALRGTPWDQIGAALGFPDDPPGQAEAEARRRYEPTVKMWSENLPEEMVDPTIFGDLTTGLRHDHDPAGTAAAMDQWIDRHSEPWDGARVDGEPGPAMRALTGT